MPEFIVSVREVWIQPIKVEAQDIVEAVGKVAEGEGDVLESKLEYSHTLDRELWTTEIVEKEGEK